MLVYGMRVQTALQHHRANRRRGLAVDTTPAKQALAGESGESERGFALHAPWIGTLASSTFSTCKGGEWAESGR